MFQVVETVRRPSSEVNLPSHKNPLVLRGSGVKAREEKEEGIYLQTDAMSGQDYDPQSDTTTLPA